MRQPLPILNQIRVASPCGAAWDGMTGDERVRHCADCDRKVYHLSGMTREAAEALLMQHEGRLCVRFYQRADGTVLTQDCRVGASRARKRMAWIAAAVAAVLGAVGLGAAMNREQIAESTRDSRLRQIEPFRSILNRLFPVSMGKFVMGEVAAPMPAGGGSGSGVAPGGSGGSKE